MGVRYASEYAEYEQMDLSSERQARSSQPFPSWSCSDYLWKHPVLLSMGQMSPTLGNILNPLALPKCRRSIAGSLRETPAPAMNSPSYSCRALWGRGVKSQNSNYRWFPFPNCDLKKS